MRKLLVLITVICMLVPMLALPAFAEAGEDDPVTLEDTGEPAVGGAQEDGAEPNAEDEAGAGDTEPEDLGDFVVGATTKLNGMFFTNMWGNNTCDIDVRSMIYGYSPVTWTSQLVFQPDHNVVYDIKTGLNESGDKLYMIAIADDLQYCDGSPITARDYAFSLLLHAAPQVTEIDGLTTNVNYIVGYDEFNTGEAQNFAGVRIFDDLTFGIVIKEEFLPFFFEMSYIDVVPYPMNVIAPGCEIVDDGEGAYIRNIDQTIEEPIFTADLLRETILDPDTGYLSHPTVTSGPYMLTDFDWETRVARFKINPYYKGNYEGQKPTVDNIVFKSVLPETMMEELENGEVQLLNKVVAAKNIDEGMELAIAGEVRNQPYYRMGQGFISFACETGPTQFQSVRQAIGYSFDKEAFLEEYLNGRMYGEYTYGYYGVGQWMVRLMNGYYDNVVIETDEELAAWGTLQLDWAESLEQYIPDAEKAKRLLIDDGWTLNEKGEAFQEGIDTVRYKDVDGELMGLIINWGKMADSIAADIIEELLVANLEALGMQVVITEVQFIDLLQHYYRQVDRTYDMMYLATNYIDVFDPSFVFSTADEFQGKINTTGYRDEHLEKLAIEMRETEPGDLYGYCAKWLAFQQYFSEVIPMLPIYTNVYFDFHTAKLSNYDPTLAGWPIAILYSTYGATAPVTQTDPALGDAGFDLESGDLESIEGTDSDTMVLD